MPSNEVVEQTRHSLESHGSYNIILIDVILEGNTAVNGGSLPCHGEAWIHNHLIRC